MAGESELGDRVMEAGLSIRQCVRHSFRGQLTVIVAFEHYGIYSQLASMTFVAKR